jgi:hypothetical protein
MSQDEREHPDPTGEDPAGGDDVEQLDDDGPDVSELDDEPDYNPDGELKDLKGG